MAFKLAALPAGALTAASTKAAAAAVMALAQIAQAGGSLASTTLAARARLMSSRRKPVPLAQRDIIEVDAVEVIKDSAHSVQATQPLAPLMQAVWAQLLELPPIALDSPLVQHGPPQASLPILAGLVAELALSAKQSTTSPPAHVQQLRLELEERSAR